MNNPKLENFGKEKEKSASVGEEPEILEESDQDDSSVELTQAYEQIDQAMQVLEEKAKTDLEREEQHEAQAVVGKSEYGQQKAEKVKKRAAINKLRSKERLCLDYFWSLSDQKRREYSEKYGYLEFLKALDAERPKVVAVTVIEDFIRKTIEAQMFESKISKFGPAVSFVKTHWVGVIRDDFLAVHDKPEERAKWCAMMANTMRIASKQLKKEGKQKIEINYTPEELSELLEILLITE